MSYAVESKKRKFHRVLESISKPNASNNVKPTSATAAAPDRIPANLSIKKVRLSNNDNSDLASVRSSILKLPRASNRNASSSSCKRPTFVPWDRECFLERLETFRRVDRWTSKPAPINEVQWAKRGWICTDVMRVSCISGCGGSVVVKLPDEIDELDGYDAEKVQERSEVRTLSNRCCQTRCNGWNADMYVSTGAKLVDEFSKLMKDGHGETCPWRNKGCDGLFPNNPLMFSSFNIFTATIQHLPLTNTDTAFSELRDRYLHLAGMGDLLPAESAIQTPEGFDLDGVIAMLPDDWSDKSPETSGAGPTPEPGQAAESTDAQATIEAPGAKTPENQTNGFNHDTTPEPSAKDSSQSINRAALAMAFFGWNAVSDGAAGLVACKACFRRLGLWMYKPKPNGDVTVYTSLDAATEHMEYCPWIDRLAQSGTGKPNEKPDNLRSGWELVVQAVKVKHRRRIRSVGSTDTLTTESMTPSPGVDEEVDEETKKKTDREWWAKIRRVRQVLTSKSPHRKSTSSK